jgi:hypothetical protein
MRRSVVNPALIVAAYALGASLPAARMGPQRFVLCAGEPCVADVQRARKHVGEHSDQTVREVLVEQEFHAGIW